MFRRFAILALSLAAFDASRAAELTDILDLPAEHTPFALSTTLVDIERTGQRLVAVGEYGVILYSDDEGASWRQAKVPVQTMLTAVDFPDSDLGWAVGHDAVILHSRDGGATWERQLDGRSTGRLLLEAAVAWEADVQARADAAGDEAGEELLMELDAAQLAVSDAEREIEVGPNRPFLDVEFTDRQHGIAVGAFGYLFETRDGGQTWKSASSHVPNFEGLHLYAIAGNGGDRLFLVGEFGFAARSTDGGASWERLDLGYDGTLFNLTVSRNAVWLFGLRGNAFYSSNGGQDFATVKLPVEASLLGGAGLPGGGVVLVGTGGAFAALRDGGATVEALNSGARRNLAAVAVDGEGNFVLAGEGGIRRQTANGDHLPASYSQ